MINGKKILAFVNCVMAAAIFIAMMIDANALTQFLVPLYWFCVMAYWSEVKTEVKTEVKKEMRLDHDER